MEQEIFLLFVFLHYIRGIKIYEDESNDFCGRIGYSP